MQLSFKSRVSGYTERAQKLCSGKHAYADPLEPARSKRIFDGSAQKRDFERLHKNRVNAKVRKQAFRCRAVCFLKREPGQHYFANVSFVQARCVFFKPHLRRLKRAKICTLKTAVSCGRGAHSGETVIPKANPIDPYHTKSRKHSV